MRAGLALLALVVAGGVALDAVVADAHPVRRMPDPDEVVLVQDTPPPPPPPPVEFVVPNLVVATPAAPPAPHVPRAHALVFRYGVGGWTGELRTFAVSLGVSGRLALAGRWEGIAGYEWLGVTYSTDSYPTMTVGSARGHRVHAGVRRPLMATTLARVITLAIDAEAGVGGLLMADTRHAGRAASLDVFAGLHGRFSGLAEDPASPSRSFGADMGVRVLARPEGTAAMFLIGFAWGS